jgi:hypothetical protein
VLSDAASGGAGSDATPSVEGGSGSDGTPGPAPEGSASPGSGPADQPGLRLVDSPEAAPVDLMATAGAPVARRLVPVAVAVVVLLLVRWAMRRRS